MKIQSLLILVVLFSGCITGKTVVDSCTIYKDEISSLNARLNEKDSHSNDLMEEIVNLQKKITELENRYMPKYEIANFSFSQGSPISFRIINTGNVKLYNLVFYLSSDSENFVFNCGGSWICEDGCSQNKNARILIEELNVNSSRVLLCGNIINATSVKLLNSTLDIIYR